MTDQSTPRFAIVVFLALGAIATLLWHEFVSYVTGVGDVILVSALPFLASGVAAGLGWPQAPRILPVAFIVGPAAPFAIFASWPQPNSVIIAVSVMVAAAVAGVTIGAKVGRGWSAV